MVKLGDFTEKDAEAFAKWLGECTDKDLEYHLKEEIYRRKGAYEMLAIAGGKKDKIIMKEASDFVNIIEMRLKVIETVMKRRAAFAKGLEELKKKLRANM